MSKLALFFLLFISAIHADFQRPWENQTWISSNPSIMSYGMEIWWDLPELDKTLRTIDINAGNINGTARSYLEESAKSQFKAGENFQACTAISYLAPLWLVSGLLPGSYVIVKSGFMSISNCMEYKANWKDAVDLFLKAVEQSELDAMESIAKARDRHAEVRFLGLCNSSFAFRDSGYCDEAEAAFATIADELTEGRYGGLHLFRKYALTAEEELNNPTPDLSSTATMLDLVWSSSGIISVFDNLSGKAESLEEDAEGRFEALLSTAEGRESLLQESIKELEIQETHLIKKAPSGFEAQPTGSVSERLEGLKKRKSSADTDFEESKLQRDRIFEEGYLALSIAGMADAGDRYHEMISESAGLLEDAQETVLQQRGEAQRLIESLLPLQNPSSDALQYLEAAEEYFEQGEQERLLGKRFTYYEKAAVLARSAAEQRSYEGQLLLQSSLSQLELMMKNAKKDGINVIAEEEEFELLKELEPHQADAYVQSSIANIIAKARTKYEDQILGKRSSILDKLSSAGPAASDLLTDLKSCEMGVVVNGQIDYHSGIGGLSGLIESYNYIEDELDQYMKDIIGNSMSCKATPILSEVELEGPAEILLDLVLTNPKNLGSENIDVSISVPPGTSFLYSDILIGQDSVEGLRMDGDDLVLTFGAIAPFETKRITLGRSSVIAHILSEKISAQGIGGGSAHVTGALDFELDLYTPHLKLPQGLKNVLIDGTATGKPLNRGKHRLTHEGIVMDAYQESVKNIKSYQAGLNSHVEYDIEIIPAMDLESVPLFVDAMNDSHISSFRIFAATGERVKNLKRLSETQYGATVTGLDKDRPTILKVSYSVENTASFVKDQLLQLEGTNASANAKALLEHARTQASGGNHTMALELIEEFKKLVKDEEKNEAKTQKKFDELHKQLMDELDGIEEVLPDAPLNFTFVAKLSARKDELSRIRDELTNSNLSQKVDLLEKVDYKWAERELKALKKDIYKEYNDLKERFFLAGNSSTPRQFLEFEDALNRLEAGLRMEYAVSALKALETVRSIVLVQEQNHLSARESMLSEFEKLSSETEELLAVYLKQASAAKGTEYSSMFTETEKRTAALIKDAEDSMEDDQRVFMAKLGNLNKSKLRMEAILGTIRNESRAKLSLVGILVGQSNLQEPKATEINSKLDTMRGMHESGDYVNALRAGTAIAKELDSYEEPENDSLLVMGITAIALLAAIGVYIVKQQKPKKEFRKLPKMGEPSDERGHSSAQSPYPGST